MQLTLREAVGSVPATDVWIGVLRLLAYGQVSDSPGARPPTAVVVSRPRLQYPAYVSH